MRRGLPASLLLCLLLFCGCAHSGAARIELGHAGAAAGDDAELQAELEEAALAVATFFGDSWREPVPVQLCANRAEFTATFPPEWGLAETACWMVATGVAERLVLLSPRAWREEACEHDPADREHLRGILRHELAHVWHGRANPTGDFTGAESLGWFIEGLAVYAAGQLEQDRLASPREAIELGLAPARLAEAWSGRYRYGVCGTLVRVLDRRLGRDGLRGLLACTTQAELLARAGLDEAELLAAWRAELLAEPSREG